MSAAAPAPAGVAAAATPRRLRGDDGAVLVEFALAAPFLLLMVFGLIDYGQAANEKNVLIRGTQAAARTGAGQGTDRFADYNVLQSIEASLATEKGLEIERVIVYHSSTPGGDVPDACLNYPVSDDLTAKGVTALGGECNIYTKAQIEYAGDVLSKFPGGNCTGGWDAHWCPSNRSRGSDTSDPDFLGVYVRTNVTPITGLFVPLPDTMSTESVFRLDPCITGVSCG